jgi:hypothetical protein
MKARITDYCDVSEELRKGLTEAVKQMNIPEDQWYSFKYNDAWYDVEIYHSENDKDDAWIGCVYNTVEEEGFYYCNNVIAHFKPEVSED